MTLQYAPSQSNEADYSTSRTFSVSIMRANDKMSESIYVPDDGYTLTGEVARVPGLFPAVRFKYRPAVHATRLQYTEAAGAAAKEQAAADIIAKQVVELRAGDSDPIRMTADQAKKLHADLSQSILYFCLGYTGPKADGADEKNCGSG